MSASKNTSERCVGAVVELAGSSPLRTRLGHAWLQLLPLKVDSFPDQQSQDEYESLMDILSSSGSTTDRIVLDDETMADVAERIVYLQRRVVGLEAIARAAHRQTSLTNGAHSDKGIP